MSAVVRGRRPGVGTMLLGLAVLHVVFGLIAFRRPLGDMLSDGLVNSTGDDDTRGFAAWFIAAGVGFGCIGLVCRQLERHHVPIPRSLGRALVVWAAAGAAVTPASGYWLLFVPAVAILRQADTPESGRLLPSG